MLLMQTTKTVVCLQTKAMVIAKFTLKIIIENKFLNYHLNISLTFVYNNISLVSTNSLGFQLLNFEITKAISYHLYGF